MDLVIVRTPYRNSAGLSFLRRYYGGLVIYDVVVNVCARLSPVPAVLLPERLLVQTSSSGGEESAGPHSG